jgi:putative peptidoglycan lipid II flippase
MRQVMRQYAPMLAGAFLMSSTVVVDQAMAAALAPGSVSTLSFGSKVVAFLLSIGSVALGTALFPHFSRMVALRDWVGIRAAVRTYGGLIIAASIPLVALLIIVAEPVTGLLFERGAFSPGDTARVARVHIFYAAQIPFYLVGTLLVRLVSSLNVNHILMWGAAISLPLNIVLNYWFMHWLGAPGIALSTTLVYLFSCCFSAVMLARHMRELTNAD